MLILYILLGLGLLTVLLSLGFGLYFLVRKDEKSRLMSNRMMRLRVASQFFSVLMLLLILFVRYNGA